MDDPLGLSAKVKTLIEVGMNELRDKNFFRLVKVGDPTRSHFRGQIPHLRLIIQDTKNKIFG